MRASDPGDARERARRSALREGLGEYTAGRYREAHDRWETVWRTLDGDQRLWVQGLIMLAAAAWHAERGRWRPARRLLVRASELLAGRDAVGGLPLLRNLPERALAAAAQLRPGNPPVLLG